MDPWRRLERSAPEVLKAQGFDDTAVHVLPRRWGVERTFAWQGRNRRLSNDFEDRGEAAETWCDLARSRLLLHRLTRPCPALRNLQNAL